MGVARVARGDGRGRRRERLAAATARRARRRSPGRGLPALREGQQRRRVRLRPRLGRRRAPRRHPLLPEAARRRAVHAGRRRALPGRAGRGSRRLDRERFAAALREIALANELSSVHVNFCRDDELAALREAGWLPRLGLQYHWINARLEATSTTTSTACATSAARKCGASCARVAEAGVAIEVRVGDDDPRRLVRRRCGASIALDDRAAIRGGGST